MACKPTVSPPVPPVHRKGPIAHGPTASRPGRFTRGLLMLMLVGTLPCVITWAERTAPVLASDPTVTPAEAALLARATQRGQTNAVAAMAILEEKLDVGTSAAIDFAMGTFALQAGQPERAQQAFRAALDKAPGFDRARRELGRTHLVSARPSEAIAALGPLLAKGTTDPAVLRLIGRALLEDGRPVAAESAFRQALLHDPTALPPRQGLVNALLAQERLSEAGALLKTLIDATPAQPRLWELHAHTLLARDKPDEAAIALECARRLGGLDGRSLATLGDLYFNAGRTADARDCYLQAAKTAPLDVKHLVRAASAFLQSGETGKADELVNALPPADRASAPVLRLRAEMARANGDAAQAGVLCNEALSLNPLEAKALLLQGDLYREAGAIENALLSYQRAARIDDTRLQALLRATDLESSRQRYADAIPYLEQAVTVSDTPALQRHLAALRRLAESR